MTTANNPMFQAKFNALARAAEVTQEEEAVAKFFWYAGLRHAFQRSTSTAALLQPVPSAPQQEPVVPSMPNPWVGLADKAKVTSWPSFDEAARISPYEAKLISLLLAEVLTNSKNIIEDYERKINAMWKYCDKDVKATEEMFKEMNRHKSKLSRLKGQISTLSQAQRKLKKISKGL